MPPGKGEIKSNLISPQEGRYEIKKKTPGIHYPLEGIREIKNNAQIYTTQEDIREIKNNLQIYITQEGIGEIKNNSQNSICF